MANRRLMGMGNRSGNRSFSQQPFQGNVNPWQGNMSNDMNQGFMNQLSNPQQLALALTSLLQPQQQQMNNPPSLLSLNAAPAYNQDRDLGRYGNRGRSDFRRPEPYNKNNRLGGGGGWRDQSRNRNRNQGGGNRNKNASQPKRAEEKKKEEKKANESVELSAEEGEDEKKRDWKEEKNKVDENDQESKDDSAVDDDTKKGKDKEGKYFGIPQHFLHCFVCSKDMWDGESFQKHVRGRAHKQMLESLEESMSITVGILRENMRLAEEKKLIELNRMQRLNKKPSRKYSDVESHCNMCDFKFLGKIMAHRKSEGHQRLKRFLHPNCNLCNKEFPSRMEWVDHRLSPEHLRELAKFTEENSKSDGAVVVFKDNESEFDLEPLMEEVTEQEDDFPIIELDDDLHDLQNRIPAYRKTRLLGSKSLIPFTGFMCQVCNTSFVSEEFSQNHLKSKKHYLKFIEAAKNKYQKQLQDEKDKEKAENEKKEGEVKVKKEEEDGDAECDAEAEEAEDANEENADNSQDVNDSEMYDPEEACTEEDKEKEESKQNGEETPVVEPKKEEPEPVEVKEEEVKEEEPKPVEASTPGRPKRQANTNVKNGAGPKSKKAKK